MGLLALEVGGSRIKWGVIEDGNLEGIRVDAQYSKGGEALVARIKKIADQAGEYDSLALALPGQPHDGILQGAGNLGISEGYPLRNELEKLGLKAEVMVNDLTAAAAGEAEGGTLALIYVGSGLGAKVVMSGQVVVGGGAGGEVGHHIFDPGGPGCWCGKRGCVELYCGWHALKGHYHDIESPSEIVARARAGDPLSQGLLERAYEAVGFAAGILVSATDPGVVRLGGGVSKAFGEPLVKAVESYLKANCWLPSGIKVEAALKGEEAPLEGLYRIATGAKLLG